MSPEPPEDPEFSLSDEAGGTPGSPADTWDRNAALRALDELFTLVGRYGSTKAYCDLLTFVTRFRWYSPFNAMLTHIQMPGATYVAPASRWLREYGRRIRAEARPLVILQPRGPVMFVFDVAQTEPGKDAGPLPREVEHPFEVRSGSIGSELTRTIENAARDGVRVLPREEGSQSAGAIRRAEPGEPLFFQLRERPEPKHVQVPLRYELFLNQSLSTESRYATLTHELAHLYCGHLGTPNPRWWPDRRGLPREVREFEAESVSYLVCGRLGLDSPSEGYLSDYRGAHGEIPPISFDCVMKVAGLLEQMGRQRQQARKADENY